MRRQTTRTLTIEELSGITQVSPQTVRTLAAKGWYRGLRRGGKFQPLALPITAVLAELGQMADAGTLSSDEARGIANYLRPIEIERVWSLALRGRPCSVELMLGIDKPTKTISLTSIARVAKDFEQSVTP